FGSQDKGTPFYSKREMNEVVKKYQKDLAAQQEVTRKQDEKFQVMVEFLSQTQGMPQLATMFPSSTTGSTSGTASASGDPSPSGNVDPSSSGSLDGDDEDDGDVS
ncbi:hypothetical protein Tco_1355747, partial [Tanacetum coccineum]